MYSIRWWVLCFFSRAYSATLAAPWHPNIQTKSSKYTHVYVYIYIYVCVYVYTHVRYNIVRLNMHIKTHSFISIYLDSDLIHWLPGFLGKICQ